MSENGLSHRGLMKMANAKLDYLLELRKVDAFIAKHGETDEIMRYAVRAEERHADRVKQIYADDRTLNLK